MTLGEIIQQFADDSVVARLLPELGDTQWQARAASAAEAQGAALGVYAGGAVERFAAGAKDEDWTSLLSALNHAADPGATCLRQMIDWALKCDAGEGAQ